MKNSLVLQNQWYIAAWHYEVPADAPLGRRICGKPIVFFRDAEGKVAAIKDRCAHRGLPLCMGKVVENGLQCGYHGIVFDGEGNCVEIPGQDIIPTQASIESYPVHEKDELIWVWVGDSEKANLADIPDYPYNNDHAKWPHKSTVYHIKANYMLLVDNLMDLTHLGYVHATTIGGNPQAHVNAEMNVETLEKGVRQIRWLRDSTPPKTYCLAVPSLGDKVDRWQEFIFTAPGMISQWTGAKNVGEGAYEGNREGGFSLRIFHGLTPETDTSCFYFWNAANGYRQDEPEATQQLFEQIDEAFTEDKIVVEAQQERISELGEEDLIVIKNDIARVHMRKLMARLAKQQ